MYIIAHILDALPVYHILHNLSTLRGEALL